MTGLVLAHTPEDSLLAKRTKTPFNCPLFDGQNLRKLPCGHKGIGLHIPKYLQCQWVEIFCIYTDMPDAAFGIYTDTTIRYLNILVGILTIFQNIGNALLENPLNTIKSFGWKIIMLVTFETEPYQSSKRGEQVLVQCAWECQPAVKKRRMASAQ